MNLTEWIQETGLALTHAGIPDARSELYRWLKLATGKDRSFFVAHSREPLQTILSSAEYQHLKEIFARRISREPLEYIAGEAAFWKSSFAVGPGVLIPRQDSELLLEVALSVLGLDRGGVPEQSFHRNPSSLFRLMDLCTGTGCLGISLIEELFRHSVMAEAILTDISPDALRYAKENISRSSRQEYLHLVECDLYPEEKIMVRFWNQAKCDLLISNPPYITTAEMAGLMPEVGDYEPRLALHGGDDGLFFYRKILSGCGQYLSEDGVILFEHGYDQGKSVPDLCAEFGFTEVRCFKDYGGNPRVTLAGRRARRANSSGGE